VSRPIHRFEPGRAAKGTEARPRGEAFRSASRVMSMGGALLLADPPADWIPPPTSCDPLNHPHLWHGCESQPLDAFVSRAPVGSRVGEPGPLRKRRSGGGCSVGQGGVIFGLAEVTCLLGQ